MEANVKLLSLIIELIYHYKLLSGEDMCLSGYVLVSYSRVHCCFWVDQLKRKLIYMLRGIGQPQICPIHVLTGIYLKNFIQVVGKSQNSVFLIKIHAKILPKINPYIFPSNTVFLFNPNLFIKISKF